jgi:hypothetical protein
MKKQELIQLVNDEKAVRGKTHKSQFLSISWIEIFRGIMVISIMSLSYTKNHR